MLIKKRKIIINLLLSFLFLTSLFLSLGFKHLQVLASSDNQLLETGVAQYKAGKYSEAIASWQEALKIYQDNKSLANVALTQENIANAYEKLGKSGQAVKYWQNAIAFNQQSENWSNVSKLQVELAQSYNKLKQPKEAQKVLCGNEGECVPDSALNIARRYQDKSTEAAALGVLGDTYRALGNYTEAIASVTESLNLSSVLDNPIYQLSGFNSLGNIYVTLAKINYYRSELASQKNDQQEQEKLLKQTREYDNLALENWEKSLTIASKLPAQSDLTATIAVNILEPLYRQNSPNFAAKREEAQKLVSDLPNTVNKVYNLINLANLIQPESVLNPKGSNYKCSLSPQKPETEVLLNQANNIAQTIGNNRAQSFVLGRLGHYYECTTNYDLALANTLQAISSAEQDLANKDSLYLWEWQAGRILNAEKQTDKAIKAYERAIFQVEEIRNNLLSANREQQLDFRTSIEPIYRELADLKLQDNTIASIVK